MFKLIFILAGIAGTPAPPNEIEMEECCPVVELRNYELKPGRRDDLIALFDQHFVEGQEQHGVRVIGQFSDRNDPAHFVWLRGANSHEARAQALRAFYVEGETWRKYGPAANDTMIDSDNVLMLNPAREDLAFKLNPANRPAREDLAPAPGRFIVATIYQFDRAENKRPVAAFLEYGLPVLNRLGADVLGVLVSDISPNAFPPLPAREDVSVVVWMAAYDNKSAYDGFLQELSNDGGWSSFRDRDFDFGSFSKPIILELEATPRSLLR